MGQIVSLEEALAIRARLQAEGKTVVFTNGHFDLLHAGHVDYLQKAKALGDVLIVGLNSDASTRALKGGNRPIVPQDQRARLLAALACVDYVLIFEETTAKSLVEALKHELYVKGGDWGEDRIPPEAEVVTSYGGRVRILPYLPGHSTTKLIKTIVDRFVGASFSTHRKPDDLEGPVPGETDQRQVILKDAGGTLHERLHVVCRHLPTDFEPYGRRLRTAADCSCGCQNFVKLPEPLGFDWGVCINPRSPRSGLLTFEHQGCEFFEAKPEADVE